MAYRDVIGQVAVNKDIFPGDSSDVYHDTTFVNWTWDTTKVGPFRLSVTLVNFRDDYPVFTHAPLKVEVRADQEDKKHVTLIHGYKNVGMPKPNTTNKYVCYPNPLFGDKYHILGVDVGARVYLLLFDMQGKILLEEVIDATQNLLEITIPHNLRGIYYIRIRDDEYTITHKILINN
ncbi:MAG: hypothetical protein ACI83I_001580 [Bacteroidia bacterium]|jgi:hypothetical protein